ncbi:MAG: 2,3-bisphosphoglycerate-independent phosphoglycerate mutase [Thermoplasmatales archaeon]|nr:2,3-bisphosphoglycerate-independent phosphoglycerate mutase [Candidatus Thermoplasmatota archaeon]MCL6002102.1 2,3-bisphosphoglycerate-independent phosphoglycerate mutase [Candidatus Thermoplasmatota archaeon]MDA8055182.1 2,3-bisphosphoglycerate-independent phosphoglycerate mutase [Thermoplasmatales archaeon]
MKILLIIADGLGDRPFESLNGKTTLEAANKPNLNRLAKEGMVGLIDPIRPGVIPGSDTSHLNYLGYDPFKYYTGRGPFEAMGTGLTLKGGDVAFRANFATVDKNGTVTDRRAGRIREGTSELAKSLNMKIEDVEVLFKEGTEHRAALVLRGQGITTDVTDNDPHAENLKPRDIVPTTKEGIKTARILNEFYKRSLLILKDHPLNKRRRTEGLREANAILYRGGGQVPTLPNFAERYSLKGGYVAAVALVSGICRLVGLRDFTPNGVTGSIDTDVRKKFSAAIEALKEVDFVIVNVKGTDIAGHDGNGIAKKEFIEKIDEAMGETIMKVRNDIVICFTGDHSTPASVKEHTSDPVPILLHYPGCRRDGVGDFDEISAKNGYLRLTGSDLMNVLLSSANRAEKYGA